MQRCTTPTHWPDSRSPFTDANPLFQKLQEGAQAAWAVFLYKDEELEQEFDGRGSELDEGDCQVRAWEGRGMHGGSVEVCSWDSTFN